jgi:hypothetical protein
MALRTIKYIGDEVLELPRNIKIFPGESMFSEPVYLELEKSDFFQDCLKAGSITLVEPVVAKEKK